MIDLATLHDPQCLQHLSYDFCYATIPSYLEHTITILINAVFVNSRFEARFVYSLAIICIVRIVSEWGRGVWTLPFLLVSEHTLLGI